METKTCHFTVCGEGLTKLVRLMYCFEENRKGAINILSSFGGMTEEQMVKVCTGDAHIEDMAADGTMRYVEKPAPEFKKECHVFLMQKERPARKIKEAEEREREELEASAKKNHIDVEDQDSLIAKLSHESESGVNKLAAPSKETIKVGRWDVPKNYLDRYANQVVKRIRGLIHMQCAGVVSISAFDPISTYNLEMERQDLHNAICDAIGVPHSEIGGERTQDQIDFDNALDIYLDEHAGKLFSGEE